VRISLSARGLGAVLLDIEGTTTPIAFVHETLFPYARAHLDQFLAAEIGSPLITDVTRKLAAEHREDTARGEPVPPWREKTADALMQSLRGYLRWLMDRDRKSPGLKLLQGEIWERGYKAGQLRGEIYGDVPPALRKWREAGIDIAIYSSGSELAQRRLFASTPHGDLTPLIRGFFDTAVGAKGDPDSYHRIASALAREPREIIFVSDVVTELAAAREAGLAVVLSLRPGNPVQPGAQDYEAVTGFGQIEP